MVYLTFTVYTIRFKALRTHLNNSNVAFARVLLGKYLNNKDIPIILGDIGMELTTFMFMADVYLTLDLIELCKAEINTALDLISSYRKNQLMLTHRMMNNGGKGAGTLTMLPDACLYVIASDIRGSLS